MIVLAVKCIIGACFFHRYTLALLRFMLFSCNLFNYMLLWFFPLGLIWFSQCMLHVLATHNVLDYLVVLISDLCTFVKLSLGSRDTKMDANKILDGTFTLKKLPNGSIDKIKVILVFCRCELSYHRSTSSLKKQLMAKHTADSNSLPTRQSQAIALLFSQQTTNICTKQSDPLWHVDKSIKMKK